MYKVIHKPILRQGRETWLLPTCVGAVKMKYLGGVEQKNTSKDRIKNDRVYEQLNIQSVETFTEQKQFGW